MSKTTHPVTLLSWRQQTNDDVKNDAEPEDRQGVVHVVEVSHEGGTSILYRTAVRLHPDEPEDQPQASNQKPDQQRPECSLEWQDRHK